MSAASTTGITPERSPIASVLRATGMVVLFALLWAVVEFVGSYARVPVEQIVFTRYATHLLALLLLFGRSRKVLLVRSQRPLLQFSRSLLMLGMPLSYLAAVTRMRSEDALAVFWIVLLAGLALSGQFNKGRLWMSGCIGYAGVFLVTHAGTHLFKPATIFSIAMGVCFTAYLFLTEYLECDSTPTNLFHSALWVFLALAFRMPFIWQWPLRQAWIALAGVGLFGLLALYALDLAIRSGGPAAFIPALYLQPVFFLLLVEGPAGFGKRAAVGTALILVAVGFAIKQHRYNLAHDLSSRR